MPESAQPGRHETNGIIERENQDVLGGIRTILIQAGLPLEFWPFAAEHYSFMHNIQQMGGSSPYFCTTGEWFRGKMLPFGCRVICRPSVTKNDKPTHKMANM